MRSGTELRQFLRVFLPYSFRIEGGVSEQWRSGSVNAVTVADLNVWRYLKHRKK